jgi:hypothetical protein
MPHMGLEGAACACVAICPPPHICAAAGLTINPATPIMPRKRRPRMVLLLPLLSPHWRADADDSALCAEAATTYPTISSSLKKNLISSAAVSGASDPCTEFSPIDRANSLRIVPARHWQGSSRP